MRLKDVLDGKWRLERKLGEGGMGSVYLAHDLALDRAVAVKLLAPALVGDAEVVARFEREARLTASLDHPNIVPVYAVGNHGGRPFIVMKKLEGQTLAELLRDKGGLTVAETVALMRQLASGLDYIHARGYVHRDIKASNIFIGPDGRATILDFGILRTGQPGEALTRTGVVMGTPHYMSPEQALGNKEIDHRADLYALAVVLFECLTGTLPFQADSELKIIQMQAYAPPPDLIERAPWIPPPVADVVRRALAKRPEDRYATATELVTALEAAAAQTRGGQRAAPAPAPVEAKTAPSLRRRAVDPGPSVAEAPPADTGSLQRALRPSRAPMLAVAALVGLIGGGGAFWWVKSGDGPTPGQDLPPPPEDPLAAQVEDAGPEPLALAVSATSEDAGAELVEEPSFELEDDAGTTYEALDLSGLDAGAGKDPSRKKLVRKLGPGRVRIIALHRGEAFWAQVQIDGVDRGRTPLELELPEGRHVIRVERTGFRPEERAIRVAKGRLAVVRVQLRP